MEPMRIRVETLQLHEDWVLARVRATAAHADIQLSVTFPCPTSPSFAELRDRARDEALRYLDPA